MFNKFFNKTKQIVVGSYKEPGVPLMSEIATRDKVDFNTIIGFLPDPDEVLKGTSKTFEVYRQIMTDSQVRACMNSRKSGTKSLLWDIDRGEKNKSKQAQLIKDFYENSVDIDEVNDAILNAPLLGFQPIEIIWGKVGQYILPIDLVPKNQEWFIFGPEGDLRLVTVGNYVTGEVLPARKFLTPTYNDIHNRYYNPYGDRLLSSCFWPATFKKTGFKWWATFTEKYGMPYIVGKLPNTQDDKRSEMKAQLQKMAMDAVAVVSDDASVEINTGGSNSNSADNYDKLIQSCDRAIAKTILGQTLTTDGSDQGSGSYSLGKVHSGIRDDIVLSDKKIVENTHNQLIRWIMEINFGVNTQLPKFEMYEEEDVDIETANRDKVVKDTGFKFTKTYMMKTYGYEEDDIEETVNPFENGNNPFNQNQDIQKQDDDTKKEEKHVMEDNVDEDTDFAEQGDYITDQLLSQFTDEQMRDQIKGALDPIFKGLDNAQDFNDILSLLDKIKPEMSTVELEDQLTKVIFIASLLGKKDAREDMRK